MNTGCCCCCCCFSVCSYTAVAAAAPAAAAVLLLPAAVRHRVPYGQIWCWFIESDSIYCFLSLHSHTRLYLMCVPLGSVVAVSASICLYYILGSYGHARSQGGVSQPRRSTPCTKYTTTITNENCHTYTHISQESVWKLLAVIPGVGFEQVRCCSYIPPISLFLRT